MSYRDPYAAGQYAPSQYNEHTPQYNDAEFNPYANAQQPYQTYDRGGPAAGYNDYNGNNYAGNDYSGNHYAQGQGQGQYRDEPFSHSNIATQHQQEVVAPVKERSVLDHEPAARLPKDQSARALREYRLMSQGSLWSKGGGGRTCARFFFCTIFIGFFLFFGVVLSMVLWLRPPNVTIGDPDSSDTTTNLTTAGITINLPVNISIINPNYLGLDLSSLTAEVFYPINNTNVGGGTMNNIKIISNGNTNFTFPFAITYQTSLDTNGKILADLLTKCGTSKSDIKVDFTITLGLKILATTIKPKISNSLSFPCPVDASDLSKFITGGKRDSLDPSEDV